MRRLSLSRRNGEPGRVVLFVIFRNFRHWTHDLRVWLLDIVVVGDVSYPGEEIPDWLILTLVQVVEIRDYDFLGRLRSILLDEGCLKLFVVVDVYLGHRKASVPPECQSSHRVVEVTVGASRVPISGVFALFESFQPLISGELILLRVSMEER